MRRVKAAPIFSLAAFRAVPQLEEAMIESVYQSSSERLVVRFFFLFQNLISCLEELFSQQKPIRSFGRVRLIFLCRDWV